jgi:hypothetical protein
MDIWAAGILLYRIVANAYPFTGENVPALLVKILQNKEPPVQELAPALPDDLADAINQCLEKNREKRLQSLEPLVETLQNYFFDMEIKDTSAWIRRYESDAQACVKDLSLILLEYHIRKENGFRAEGDEEKAQAHLQEAKKYDSKELPINIVRDAIKKRETSAIFKKSPRVSSLKKTSTWRIAPDRKPMRVLVIVSCLVLAAILTGGWIAFSHIVKKGGPDTALLAYNRQPSAIPRTISDSSRSTPTKVSQSTKTTPASASTNRSSPTSKTPSKPALSSVKTQGHGGLFGKVPDHYSNKAAPAETMRATRGDSAVLPQPTLQVLSPGIIKVAVTPPEAGVTINGDRLSAREMVDGKRLKPGTYIIIASAAGYEQFSKTIALEKGDVQIVSADLPPLVKEPGSLHIYSSPWAEIYIDGAFSGNSPTSKPLFLSAGQHTVTLKRSGFKTYEEVVTVANGELKRLKVKLEETP